MFYGDKYTIPHILGKIYSILHIFATKRKLNCLITNAPFVCTIARDRVTKAAILNLQCPHLPIAKNPRWLPS